MNAICIISARGKSKGIPQKNIQKLGGKPLIAHSIETAINSKLFKHVIVSTEDEKIASIAKQYGAEIPFMRPKRLALDSTPLEYVLIYVLKKLKSMDLDFDTFAIKDCTVPFIDEKDMKGAMKLFEKSNCDGVFAAIRAHPNPYFGMMEINSKGYIQISKPLKNDITRRQNAPHVFDIDGLYILKVNRFLKTTKIFMSQTISYEITKVHGHMIDFKIAECIYNLKKESK